MGRSTTSRPGTPPQRAARERREDALFLLVVFARPANEGGPQPLLVFVQGADVNAALARALRELAVRGWNEVDVTSAKVLPDDPAGEDDPIARDAMIRAREAGFDLIRYGI